MKTAERLAQEEIPKDAAYSIDIFFYGVDCVKAGAKNERQKIADQVKTMTIDQITDSETLYNAILNGA